MENIVTLLVSQSLSLYRSCLFNIFFSLFSIAASQQVNARLLFEVLCLPLRHLVLYYEASILSPGESRLMASAAATSASLSASRTAEDVTAQHTRLGRRHRHDLHHGA